MERDGFLEMCGLSADSVSGNVSTVYIHATSQQVWAALTEPSLTRLYFDFMVGFMEVDSDWRVGSPVLYRTGDGQVQIEGEIVRVDPPRELVTSFSLLYSEEVAEEPPSRLAWHIEEMGDVSKVTVTHDDAGRGDGTTRDVATCMPAILSNLKIQLETGKPRHLKEIVFDCASPSRLGTFWAEAMGYIMQGPPPTEEDDFIGIVDPHCVGPELGFQRVPEPKVVKNRVHLDLHVIDLPAEIDRLEALGGVVALRLPDRPAVVMRDPEGNEFCVVST